MTVSASNTRHIYNFSCCLWAITTFHLIATVPRSALARNLRGLALSNTYVPCFSAQECPSISAPRDSSYDPYDEFAERLSKCSSDTRDCLDAGRTLLDDQPGCLAVGRVWWSSKTNGIPVTVVTQLPIARLGQLQEQCDTWQGPLAAAVYLPLINAAGDLSEANMDRLLDAFASVEQLFNANEEASDRSCQLRLSLMYELFNDADAANVRYPANTLRNYARLMADTDLVAFMEVDLVPSLSVSQAFADLRILTGYVESCRSGAVYVLPAFTNHCNNTELADSIALVGKEALRHGLKTCIRPSEDSNSAMFDATLYDRWFTAHDAFQVPYKMQYELSYLSWRWSTPWFDARYRGYRYDGLVQAAAMNASGATWFVSPHGFVIRRSHDHGRMRADGTDSPTDRLGTRQVRDALHRQMAGLRDAALSASRSAGGLEVLVEDSFRKCLGSLPWWQADWKPA